MPNSQAFMALLRKETVTAITNQTFVLLFGVPVVIATFLGLTFSSDRQAAAPVALVVSSAVSTGEQIDSAIRELPTLRVVGTYGDPQSALALAREGRAVAVIDLSEARVGERGLEGLVILTLDESRPVLSEVVRSTLQTWISGGQVAPTVTVRISILRGLNPRDSTIPLWLLIAALSVSLGSVPLLVTEEKEHRTLLALLVTPLGATTIVAAKTTLGTATILLMCGLILGLNRTSVADPLLLLTVLVIGAVGLVCLGLLIGTLAPNQASAAPFASVTLLLLILPVILAQVEGTPVLRVAELLPTYHLNAIVSASLFGGATVLNSAGQLAYLAAFGIVGGVLAIRFMGRESATS